MTNLELQEHSQEMLKIIDDYSKNIDEEILNSIREYRNNDVSHLPVTVGFISSETSEIINKITGKNVVGNRILLDSNGINHIEMFHGEKGKHDNSMSNPNDIARMSYVISNYDDIDFFNEYAEGYVDKDGKRAPKIVISKRIDGVYYIIEAVCDTKKKRNYIITAFIGSKEWLNQKRKVNISPS